MKLVTAQVVDGRIEVPPEIGDGSQVAVLAADDEEPLTLSPGEEQKLSEALTEIDAGRYLDGWTLLEELKTKATPNKCHPPRQVGTARIGPEAQYASIEWCAAIPFA